jgi:hypothetical protein
MTWAWPTLPDEVLSLPELIRSLNQRFRELTSSLSSGGGVVYPVLSGELGVRDTRYPVGNVLRYGAVADGNVTTGAGTDNTPAFQRAITAAGAPGRVTVPAGVFKLASQITIPSSVTMMGAGNWATVLFAPTAFNDATGLIRLNGVGGPPTVLENMAIGGQQGGAGVASVGVYAQANASTLRNIWVTAFQTNIILANSNIYVTECESEETVAGGTGISIIAADVTIANCVIYSCYIGLSVANVPFLDGTITITGCQALACSYICYQLSQSSNIQIDNCSAGHNNLTRVTNAAMSIDGCSYVVVSNFIGRLGSGPSTTAIGISVTLSNNIQIVNPQLTNSWQDGIYIFGSSAVSVTGGNCSNNNRRGIFISGGDRVVITGVTCLRNGSVAGTTDAGIYSDNTATFSTHMITGCLCSQNGGDPQDYGIYANLTNNGASSGFTNLVGNTLKFNGLNLNKAGLVANIGDTGNLI